MIVAPKVSAESSITNNLYLLAIFLIFFQSGRLPIKLGIFFWVSMAGMFPATLVYVNAGNELSKINSFSDILSFQFLISFSLIGLLPLTIKFLLKKVRRKN